MILVTDKLRERLLANGAVARETDHVPVLKLFNPCGAATWIVTEMMADGDTLFCLADLGFGCPELGYSSLAEIESVKLPFGLTIERDILFKPRFPLSVYAEAARATGGIVEAEHLLTRFALLLGTGAPRDHPCGPAGQ